MEEIAQTSLYHSHICRLCAEKNSNGYQLFCGNSDEPDFSELINSYLPVKINDDGKYPRWICPGCHLQVESTVQFFNLVEAGQQTLESLYRSKSTSEESPFDNNGQENVVSSETDSFSNIKDQTNFRIHKKRGRPKKVPLPPPEQIFTVENIKNDHKEIENELNSNELGRRKRQTRMPSKFQGIVQGKELEKVFIESGVIDQTDGDSDTENIIQEISSFVTYPYMEVIGHLQGTDGKNLGYLVVFNSRTRRKTQKRKTRFMCDVCKVCFAYEQKFLEHRFSHNNVKFECKKCLLYYTDRNHLIEHQTETGHEGIGLIEEFQTPPTTVIVPESDVKCATDNNLNQLTWGSTNTNKVDDISKINEEYPEPFEEIDEIKDNNVDPNDIPIKTEKETTFEIPQTVEDIEKCLHNHQAILIDQNQSDNTPRPLQTLRYSCTICNQNFKRLSSYIYHRETEHNNRRRFICSTCSKPFRNKVMLQRHQLVHSNARPFKCEFCDAAFKTKAHLFYHEKSHTGEKEHQCHICQRFFAHKNSLTLHIRSHTGYKPFKCSVCGKAFTQQGNMQEHMRIHTGECPFECHICGRRFKTSSQVRMHIKRHEGNKPMKCNLCGKAFVQIAELRNHQRRHNNIKPYDCEECGKSFINLSAVKKHQRLHTGEKPYSCKECQRRFADASNLKKHMKIHEMKRKTGNIWENPEKPKSASEVLDSFTDSLDYNSQSNFTINNGKDSQLIEEAAMWDLIEEDVCFDSSNTSNIQGVKGAPSNSVNLNISYPDLSDTMRNKTLFFVQETSAETLSDKTGNLYQTLTLNDISSENQLMQSNSNVFVASDSQMQNAIQTVILNIQTPLNINLAQTSELFQEDNETSKSISQLQQFPQQQKGYTSFIDSLDTPD